MHHWTLSTCETLGDGPVLCAFWRENIVQVGLRCDFVMRGILGVAALHLAYLNRQRKPELVERSVRHHDVASKQVSDTMQAINQGKNPVLEEDLFAFSVLTLYHRKFSTDIAPLILYLITETLVGQIWIIIYDSREFINIVLGIVMSSADNFTDAFLPGPLDRLPQSPDWMVFFNGAARFALTPSIRDNHRGLIFPLMREIESLFHHRQYLKPGTYMSDLRSRIGSLDLDPSSPLARTYERAMQELDQTLGTSIESPAANSTMHIFIWLHCVSEDFIPLIRENHAPQEALVILNYACMIPPRLPRRWWLEDWASQLRNRAYELLDDEHRSWLVEPRFQPEE